MATANAGLNAEQLRTFEQQGYMVIPGMFTPYDVRLLLGTFMEMHAGGPIPGCFMPKARLSGEYVAEGGDLGLTPNATLPAGMDILDIYPRMMHPHRVNDVARRYLLDRRLEPVLHHLVGEDSLASPRLL